VSRLRQNVSVIGRLIVFAVGVFFLVVAWLFATRDYWSAASWRSRGSGASPSPIAFWMARLDFLLSRVLPSILFASLGASALTVSVLGLLE
jgi:hypothetical protein